MLENNEIKFSSKVVEAIESAAAISNELGEKDITPLDIVISSFVFKEGSLVTFLKRHNKDSITGVSAYELVQKIKLDEYWLEKITGYSYHYKSNFNISLYKESSKELKNIFVETMQYEVDKGNKCIHFDTLIYFILKKEHSLASKLLRRFYNTYGMMDYLEQNLSNKSDDEEYEENTNSSSNSNGEAPRVKDVNVPDNLKMFVNNINVALKKGNKSDILGRDDEIFSVWSILSKKTKSNVVLIGKPGVGKTAIVEAIAQSIVNGKCPQKFRNYTVLSLELTSMVAGTSYRGQFEQRAKDLIKFIGKTKNIIVFIDEIHQILGAGNCEGSGPDLSGALKPILARDDACVIGATTIDEYNRIFTKDGALSRRFETLIIKEPKFNEVLPMIKSRVENLSKYHNVKISDKMLDLVLVNAYCFSDIANPDKTIDLLDKSMAIAAISNDKDLKPKHIHDVYKSSFNNFEKMTYNMKQSTAYHEAGHFVAWYLSETKLNQDIVVISIIPHNNYLGINVFEEFEVQNTEGNMKYLKDRVSVSLAGRIAQKFINCEFDAGASADLAAASLIVEQYIIHYGIDEEYLNYSFDTNPKVAISDNESDKIRKKTKKFIDDTYTYTEDMLKDNKRLVDNVANLLIKNGIITKEEAINVCKIKKNSKV